MIKKFTEQQLRAKADEFASIREQGDENLLKKIEEAALEFSEKISIEELIAGLKEIIEE